MPAPIQRINSFENFELSPDLRDRGPQRVLIVDDEADVLRGLRNVMEGAGYAVTCANTLRQAVTTMRSHRFDLVLMDLQMPVLGGVDATIAIRRTHGAMLLPVIALTADVLVSERENAMRQGMNDFLSKPIDPAKVLPAR